MKIDEKYAELLKDTLAGTWTKDRTSVGESCQAFGGHIRFDTGNVKYPFAPFLQIRTLAPRIAFEEFRWMLSGSTDVTELQKKNIGIWDGNSTREFLDERGLTNVPENNIGKAYGYQYRNFGGVTDQVQNVFNSLRGNPTSRRHVISIWNPNELHEMALEPCFHLYEFVYINGKLNLYVHGRSSDVTFGLPYNLAFSFFWLLTFSKALGYKTGELFMTMSNIHVYKNQIPLVEKMLEPKHLEETFKKKIPQVNLTKDISTLDDILNLEFSDFEIINFERGPELIKGIEMAV